MPRRTCASSTTTNASSLEERPPQLVVGKDPDVQHVRVREDDVRLAPDRRAAPRRRVAVVGLGADLVQLEARDLSELVLREGFRR